MATNLNHVIENSLFAQSVLSPVLGDAGDSKKNLLNRIKKLNQGERSELVKELNEICLRIDLPKEGSLPDHFSRAAIPLQEKGLSTFLLSDDGKQAEEHWFIVSFFLGLMNRMGKRIGSDFIMEQLYDTRALLRSRGYEIRANEVNAEPGLNAYISFLEDKLKEKSPAEKINPLIDELEKIKLTFNDASSKDWASPGVLLQFQYQLAFFKKQLQTGPLSDSIRTTVEEAIQKITNIIQESRTQSRDVLSANLRDNALPVLKNFGFSENLLESFGRNLSALARGEQLPEKVANIGYWRRKVIIPYIGCQLSTIKKELQGIISSFELEQRKTQTELEIIHGRLEKYQYNSQNAIKRGSLATATLSIKAFEKEWKDSALICGVISSAIVVISQAKVKSLEWVKNAVELIYADVAGSPNIDESKAKGDFKRDLQLLKDFSYSDFSMNRQPLANALDKLESLRSNPQGSLDVYTRLNQFKSNPSAYDLTSDLKKINFIDDYFAYWKFIFDQSKLSKAEELNNALGAKKKIEEELTLSSSSVPKPVVGVRSPTVTQNPIVISETKGDANLRAIAKGLQNHRSNSSMDSTWYGQVVAGPKLHSDLVKQVYGNFYWIMKDAGKLCGKLQSDGHAEDSNWGGEVFTSGSLDGVQPAVIRPLLNHYRVQAMAEVLEDKIRTRANQAF